MKVLLIRPQAPNTLSFINILDNEPLELEYLYTALAQKGIKSVIYDGLIEKRSVKDVILSEKPDFVAITGYITQEKLMHNYAKIANENNIKTIIGGVHCQLNPHKFYADYIDYIYRSESVSGVADLVLGEKLSEINGLIYKKDGKYIENKNIPININDLPIPNRDFFHQNKEKYKYLHLNEIATMKTSFSCPYDCNFCYCTNLSGGKYQTRDLDLVIEEILTIQSDNIQIVDDDFLVSRERLEKFIQLIIDNNIKKTFICYARADFIAKNYDIVEKLSQIGFKYFLVGIEAISDAELISMNKKTSMDDNRMCIQNIQKANANCIALMIAPLDATEEYFDKLYDFVVEMKLLYVTVSIFTPIEGTKIYDEYKDRIISEDILDYDFLHLTVNAEKMSNKEFYKCYRKMFIKLYKIGKKSGIYDFIDHNYYKNMVLSYLTRKIRGF